MSENIKNILFLGDITGRLGRFVVRDLIEIIKTQNFDHLNKNITVFEADFDKLKNIDLIIANCENASGGFGLTKKNYEDLISWGVNILTSGNHIWDKPEIFNYINDAQFLLRPINYDDDLPGVGYKIFDFTKNYKIGVISVLGNTFMPFINSFWKPLEDIIENIKKVTPNIFIDFHAEATAEKICLMRFVSNLKVSAIIGTHTHVATSDQEIFNNHTAYMTDVGFCGAKDSVIGMDYQSSLYKLRTGIKCKSCVIIKGEGIANGCIITLDASCGKAVNIERLKFIKHYN